MKKKKNAKTLGPALVLALVLSLVFSASAATGSGAIAMQFATDIEAVDTPEPLPTPTEMPPPEPTPTATDAPPPEPTATDAPPEPTAPAPAPPPISTGDAPSDTPSPTMTPEASVAEEPTSVARTPLSVWWVDGYLLPSVRAGRAFDLHLPVALSAGGSALWSHVDDTGNALAPGTEPYAFSQAIAGHVREMEVQLLDDAFAGNGGPLDAASVQANPVPLVAQGINRGYASLYGLHIPENMPEGEYMLPLLVRWWDPSTGQEQEQTLTGYLYVLPAEKLPESTFDPASILITQEPLREEILSTPPPVWEETIPPEPTETAPPNGMLHIQAQDITLPDGLAYGEPFDLTIAFDYSLETPQEGAPSPNLSGARLTIHPDISAPLVLDAPQDTAPVTFDTGTQTGYAVLRDLTLQPPEAEGNAPAPHAGEGGVLLPLQIEIELPLDEADTPLRATGEIVLQASEPPTANIGDFTIYQPSRDSLLHTNPALNWVVIFKPEAFNNLSSRTHPNQRTMRVSLGEATSTDLATNGVYKGLNISPTNGGITLTTNITLPTNVDTIEIIGFDPITRRSSFLQAIQYTITPQANQTIILRNIDIYNTATTSTQALIDVSGKSGVTIIFENANINARRLITRPAPDTRVIFRDCAIDAQTTSYAVRAKHTTFEGNCTLTAQNTSNTPFFIYGTGANVTIAEGASLTLNTLRLPLLTDAAQDTLTVNGALRGTHTQSDFCKATSVTVGPNGVIDMTSTSSGVFLQSDSISIQGDASITVTSGTATTISSGTMDVQGSLRVTDTGGTSGFSSVNVTNGLTVTGKVEIKKVFPAGNTASVCLNALAATTLSGNGSVSVGQTNGGDAVVLGSLIMGDSGKLSVSAVDCSDYALRVGDASSLSGSSVVNIDMQTKSGGVFSPALTIQNNAALNLTGTSTSNLAPGALAGESLAVNDSGVLSVNVTGCAGLAFTDLVMEGGSADITGINCPESVLYRFDKVEIGHGASLSVSGDLSTATGATLHTQTLIADGSLTVRQQGNANVPSVLIDTAATVNGTLIIVQGAGGAAFEGSADLRIQPDAIFVAERTSAASMPAIHFTDPNAIFTIDSPAWFSVLNPAGPLATGPGNAYVFITPVINTYSIGAPTTPKDIFCNTGLTPVMVTGTLSPAGTSSSIMDTSLNNNIGTSPSGRSILTNFDLSNTAGGIGGLFLGAGHQFQLIEAAGGTTTGYAMTEGDFVDMVEKKVNALGVPQPGYSNAITFERGDDGLYALSASQPFSGGGDSKIYLCSLNGYLYAWQSFDVTGQLTFAEAPPNLVFAPSVVPFESTLIPRSNPDWSLRVRNTLSQYDTSTGQKSSVPWQLSLKVVNRMHSPGEPDLTGTILLYKTTTDVTTFSTGTELPLYTGMSDISANPQDTVLSWPAELGFQYLAQPFEGKPQTAYECDLLWTLYRVP